MPTLWLIAPLLTVKPGSVGSFQMIPTPAPARSVLQSLAVRVPVPLAVDVDRHGAVVGPSRVQFAGLPFVPDVLHDRSRDRPGDRISRVRRRVRDDERRETRISKVAATTEQRRHAVLPRALISDPRPLLYGWFGAPQGALYRSTVGRSRDVVGLGCPSLSASLEWHFLACFAGVLSSRGPARPTSTSPRRSTTVTVSPASAPAVQVAAQISPDTRTWPSGRHGVTTVASWPIRFCAPTTARRLRTRPVPEDDLDGEARRAPATKPATFHGERQDEQEHEGDDDEHLERSTTGHARSSWTRW